MNYKVKIYEVLKDLGVSPSLQGYHYISYIVECYLTNEYVVTDKTMYVYHKTAEKFNTVYSRLERCVRHVVGKCCESTSREVMFKYFGNCFDSVEAKLTNSDFLLGIVEYIKVHSGEYDNEQSNEN